MKARECVRAIILSAYCLTVTSALGDVEAITLGKTESGIEFGIMGPKSGAPTPVLVVLSGTIEGTLGSAYFRQCGNDLMKVGVVCVSIDIPCHGTQTGEGKPKGLSGWGVKAAKGENVAEEFNARMSQVLDHLIKTGVADPEKIAVCGTSRGGFLALHFAAHDPRVTCVAAFAPVTDPAALSEFKGKETLAVTKAMSLETQAMKLAGRPVWVVIGDQDARVSTRKAIDFAQAVTAASIEQKKDSQIELRIMPEPRGHTTPRGAAAEAAKWIMKQLFPG